MAAAFFANDSRHTKEVLISDYCHKISFHTLVWNINHLTRKSGQMPPALLMQ